MSRRDDGSAQARPSCRSTPGGASPAWVSAGAPSSRPRTCEETRAGQAGCQEPLWREQVRGRQQHVKRAASLDVQPERRGGHVAAKTTSRVPPSGDARARELGGVRSAARGHGAKRNTRDPSAPPGSGPRGSYQPPAKSSAAQRESEGTVVVPSRAPNNARGAKGPCGGSVGGARPRAGMTERSNHPGGREFTDNVRQLQRRRWSVAKQQPGRRCHARYDRIYRRDVLWEAWRRVKRNRGAAGVDAMTLVAVEPMGIEAVLEDRAARLRAGTSRPAAGRRQALPKEGGQRRPLGIPTVRDRVAQMAATLVLEPIFAADFLPGSYGFRPQRSATQALETLRRRGAQGGNPVLDADIRDYFGSLDHGTRVTLVARRVSDRRVRKRIRQWLQVGVMEDGQVTASGAGTPPGGVISPLRSNSARHVLDRVWMRRSPPVGVLVRAADDFVVRCPTKAACERAEPRGREILARLGWAWHPDKTRQVDLSGGRAGFAFLGGQLRKRWSGRIWETQRKRLYFLQRWPSRRAMQRVRARGKALTPRSVCQRAVRDTLAQLNPVLRGWGAYFRTGHAAVQCGQVDHYVAWRLKRLLVKRHGRTLRPGGPASWTPDYFHALGLHRLRGTIQYPEAASCRVSNAPGYAVCGKPARTV
jgi:RNA-directed DNA polymerase